MIYKRNNWPAGIVSHIGYKHLSLLWDNCTDNKQVLCSHQNYCSFVSMIYFHFSRMSKCNPSISQSTNLIFCYLVTSCSTFELNPFSADSKFNQCVLTYKIHCYCIQKPIHCCYLLTNIRTTDTIVIKLGRTSQYTRKCT